MWGPNIEALGDSVCINQGPHHQTPPSGAFNRIQKWEGCSCLVEELRFARLLGKHVADGLLYAHFCVSCRQVNGGRMAPRSSFKLQSRSGEPRKMKHRGSPKLLIKATTWTPDTVVRPCLLLNGQTSKFRRKKSPAVVLSLVCFRTSGVLTIKILRFGVFSGGF